MNRLKSGVPGFDQLVNGGFHENSINLLLAEPGAGKSTFCWQFVYGDPDQPALFISLEQSLASILRDCKQLKLHKFEEKYKKGLLQYHLAFSEGSELTTGRIALNFFMEELKGYLGVLEETSKQYKGGLRIAIDPMTPLMLEITDLNEQRNIIQRIFTRLRRLGTTIVTLEKGFGESQERIPSYLCDSLIELDNIGLGGILNRTIRIRKFRGSSHSEQPNPIGFEVGKGLIVHEFKNK